MIFDDDLFDSRLPESPDDDFDELPDEATSASCPYCGEVVQVFVDPGGQLQQEYIEDCPVCCRPWRVRVSWYDGEAVVALDAEDE